MNFFDRTLFWKRDIYQLESLLLCVFLCLSHCIGVKYMVVSQSRNSWVMGSALFFSASFSFRDLEAASRPWFLAHLTKCPAFSKGL